MTGACRKHESFVMLADRLEYAGDRPPPELVEAGETLGSVGDPLEPQRQLQPALLGGGALVA